MATQGLQLDAGLQRRIMFYKSRGIQILSHTPYELPAQTKLQNALREASDMFDTHKRAALKSMRQTFKFIQIVIASDDDMVD